MAIAQTNAGYNRASSSGGAASVSLTTSGSDRLAIMFIWSDHPTNVPSCTVGGSGATLITQVQLNSNQRVTAYYYPDPPTGSTSYSSTTSGGKSELHVITYSDCDTSTVPDSSATTSSSTSPTSFSTTVVASDCWLASMIRDFTTGTGTASTGTTQRNAGVGAKSGDSNGTVGTGSQSMTWTHSGTCGGIIVSIAPPAAAGGSFTPHTTWIN